MAIVVVNIRHDPYDVYIGRAGHGQDGFWGNPVKVGQRCPECGQVHTSGGSTLVCYEAYLLRCMRDPRFVDRMRQLKGKRLGCFCKPNACHGDILKKHAERL